MTKLQKQKEAFIEAVKTLGYSEDKYGHLQKEVIGKQLGTVNKYRIKLGDNGIRYEVKGVSVNWVRLYSGYYKDLSVADGKIKGLRR